jgi:hypothetical protein
MPGWWRLGGGAGVSMGLIAIFGLIYHRASVRFERS